MSPSGAWVESAGAGDAKHSGSCSAGFQNHIFCSDIVSLKQVAVIRFKLAEKVEIQSSI